MPNLPRNIIPTCISAIAVGAAVAFGLRWYEAETKVFSSESRAIAAENWAIKAQQQLATQKVLWLPEWNDQGQIRTSEGAGDIGYIDFRCGVYPCAEQPPELPVDVLDKLLTGECVGRWCPVIEGDYFVGVVQS